jgi:phosphotransacetylase
LIGPILSGLAAPAQIVHLDASSQDIVTGAAFAANDAIKNKKNNK